MTFRLTHRLTLKILFPSNHRALSGKPLRSLPMAQRIRTDEGVLRIVPPPGQAAPLVFFSDSPPARQLTDSQLTESRREKRFDNICTTLLQ